MDRSELTSRFSAPRICRSMPLPGAELQRALGHLRRGDWQAAHELAQKDEQSALACWLHGIVEIAAAGEELRS